MNTDPAKLAEDREEAGGYQGAVHTDMRKRMFFEIIRKRNEERRQGEPLWSAGRLYNCGEAGFMVCWFDGGRWARQWYEAGPPRIGANGPASAGNCKAEGSADKEEPPGEE